MKTTLRSLSVFAFSLAVIFTACKKDNSSQQSQTELATEVQDHADDQTQISSSMDDVANDADLALETSASFTGRLQQDANTASFCGATAVADTTSNPRTITITYSGNNCQGTAYRTGTVVLSMPKDTKWRNAGATITASFQNLKIKRLADNKSITINGSQNITNVKGGLLRDLPTLQSIVHTISSGNMSITFDDGSQRTWQVSRKREFNYDNGVVLSIRGTGNVGTATNVAEWGANRFGHAFTTSITQPLVFRQDCNGRLTSGEVKHEGFATATVAFGLNASGQPTACPGTGNYYYKLTWTVPNGNTASVILPY